MSRIYVMEKGGATKTLPRIACTDEDKELQRLLANNLYLLPPDQISPGNNLRWLLVKREMPVVNPASGDYSWSIDFLLADQDGVPTFVECKRRNDPRSRREVVGQVLEYAANGRYYWTASEFRSHAQNAAGGESALNEKLKELTGDAGTTAEQFFSGMEKNLQRSKLRLIFFLEDSPHELRSIVEFLNGQLKDMEVLIVEARQYQHGEARIVVPWVFGYTEEARVAKRDSKMESERSSPVKGQAAFWESVLRGTLADERKSQIREFIAMAGNISGCEVSYLVTCLIALPAIVPRRTLLGIRREGDLEIYVQAWDATLGSTLTDQQIAARGFFLKELSKIIVYDQHKQFPRVPPEEWIIHSRELLKLIEKLVAFCPPHDVLSASHVPPVGPPQ